MVIIVWLYILMWILYVCAVPLAVVDVLFVVVLSDLPTKPYTNSASLPRYMPRQAHPRVEHSNIWYTVQVMKLIMQFSPAFYYFIPLGSKYSPQHPESMFFP
jgi:hypothetical protein